MARLAGALSVVAATWFTLALVSPSAVSSAALDTAVASIPVDPATTLEIHTTADCVLADNRCYFTTSANLRGPGGPIPFPPDFYARQNTTLRSMDRTMFLGDSTFSPVNTRQFKSIGPVEFATVYFGSGPPEKFRVTGSTRTVDWSTGAPKTDADYIVCAYIQAVYGGINLTTPTACAQTTYG